MAKNKFTKSNIVFSTDPAFSQEENQEEKQETLPAKEQPLRLRLETKHRGGKALTILSGFVGTADDFEQFSKKLKAYCGTGGSIKDGETLLQGDNRDKLMTWFLKNGYSKAKKAGG